MQEKGWSAYSKTSQESCPVYGMGTYMDGEQQIQSKAVPASGSLHTTKIQGIQ